MSTRAAEQTAEALESIGQHQDSEGAEYRILGPPGCGKTTNTARQVRRAVDKYGENAVLVTSFSRTAAAELAGRDLPIPASQVGTLHSHCYRALGHPELAESKVEDWNAENPSMVITQQGKADKIDEGGDEGTGSKDGDYLLEEMSRLRGLMLEPDFWPPNVRHFAKKWEEYKSAHGLLDFTDLIEVCLRDTSMAPGAPSVLFADEAQDLTRMMVALVRRWGQWARHYVVVGDDDQCIFGFTGADPDVLIDPPIPERNIIVLKQSYRVPVAVHAEAVKWIKAVRRRQEKEYFPRAFPGKVERLAVGTWEDPGDTILRLLESHLNEGQSVMFLASCTYQLRPLIKMLRDRGWPFHNPYRRSNGAWNPIRTGKSGTAPNRILALLAAHPSSGPDQRRWTRQDVALWADWLKAEGVMKRGKKKTLHEGDMLQLITEQDLDEVFTVSALDELLASFEGDRSALLEWWLRRLDAAAQARAEFPVTVCKKHGPEGLTEEPRIILGTIHSVKGGEADVVVLWPDLSAAGALEYGRAGNSRDSVIRQFYVGMTRAREVLYIGQRASTQAVII
jgi:DNA helicase II / ATP-dependent DNA helicase PcrA